MCGRVALSLPVWAEVAIWDLVADDVVVGDEEVVTDRADCFWFAASAASFLVSSFLFDVTGFPHVTYIFFIIAGLPGSAEWAIGLLVGINLLFGGATLIGMALAARNAAP